MSSYEHFLILFSVFENYLIGTLTLGKVPVYIYLGTLAPGLPQRHRMDAGISVN